MTAVSDDDPIREVPLSALEHYAYCDRQTALIHVEGVWSESADTVRGDLSHRVVDLPGLTRRAGVTVVRSLPVASEEYGLRGICDVVEFAGQVAAPVEYKVGKYRPDGPAELQLTGQALCLIEAGFEVPVGYVYSVAERRRHAVSITPDLVTAPLPPPRRSAGCSRSSACRWRATTPVAATVHFGTTACPKSPTARRGRPTCSPPDPSERGVTELLNTLYVQTPGTSLHLDGDTVRVYHPEQTGRRLLPLVRLNHVVLFAGVTITDDLLLRCAEDGRSVSWLSGAGRFRARVAGPTSGNPLLRRAQHRAAEPDGHRLTLGAAMVAGKIHNSRQVLLRAARDSSGHRQTALRGSAELLAKRLPLLREARSADEILGVEGIAARDYFGALPYLIRQKEWQAVGRNKRPPTDPVNCLLSFLYGMLRVAVHGALEQVGLDPYIGFLHGIRPGKPALALDLMEEFRPLLADRLAFTLINRGEVTTNDFEKLPNGAYRLTEAGRKCVLTAWQESRRRAWPHAQLKREVEGAVLPLVQARLLARHLRGDLPSYQPWMVN
ncbi:type I-C CRISPR-associated endonuclease Cas1c [Micromonospora sp. WMMD1102]|uniref:type I-C CRISPR-associated endonuclease Cas1c n=1 Tax=Micromonospora sp. WMMD1102 TaxID=3016105 RepID=UPI00241585DC|nr:type I-C CRISPR-associated endonuclease Cas1c [Micromonospora sp. WMMD1102]MDG4788676.1 type I-C CRISPR-associated endonuclease Cas1c [Micromonospora sp. WMMD1102]